LSGLRVENLSVRYGRVAAVRDVSFSCEFGEMVAILGPNGAGKSSTLVAIAGGLASSTVTGSVSLGDRPLAGLVPEALVRAGIALVPERRRIFGTLTVEENLRVGGTVRGRDREVVADVEAMMQRFPILGERRTQRGGLLSGGEQQQLAIARALMSRPRMLLLDEPSLGLAPLIVNSVFEILDGLRNEGIGIVLVEQSARRAINMADRSFLMRGGELVAAGDETVQSELTAALLGDSVKRAKA
jgi:branched-chain amino acid transport system ATP-binding protein